MITLAQLWIPILVSSVLVFIASSLIHMVFKWHNSDFLKLSNEDEVRTAVSKTKPAPGQYVLPHCNDMKAMQSPEAQQKFKDGPVGMIVLRANGAPNMGATLGQWFALTLVFAVIAAYVASRTVPMGASFLAVCRVVSIVSFLAYAGGSIQAGIWYGKPWRSVAKDLLDGFIYATLTGCTFAWLWPH